MIVSIIAGFLCSQLLGMAWYSPIAFGDPWMQGIFPGKSFEEIGKGMTSNTYCVSMAAYACLSIFLNIILSRYTRMSSLQEAVCTGLMITGPVFLAGVPHLMFAGRPLIPFLVDIGFDVVVIISMCVCVLLLGGSRIDKKSQ